MSYAEEALEAQRRVAVILQEIVDGDARDLEAKNALANSHFTRGYVLVLYLNKPVEAL
jgi:hypothetical protein